MKILVIENEAFLAENLCRCLKKIENLSIEHVTSAREAMNHLAQQSYDVVISDLWLPDSKSDTWLLEVGKIRPHQSLIVISSYPIPPQISSSDDLNIIGYFEKPFDVKIVVNLINQLTKL